MNLAKVISTNYDESKVSFDDFEMHGHPSTGAYEQSGFSYVQGVLVTFDPDMETSIIFKNTKIKEQRRNCL
jgi:hypothetical protein